MMRTSLLIALGCFLIATQPLSAQFEPTPAEPSQPEASQEQPAQEEPSATVQDVRESDPEFQKLSRGFRVIYESIRNARAVVESDKPAIQAFRDRVEQYLQEHPDHERAVAMALQLALWLDDRQHAAELYERLVQLRSNDVELNLAWLEFREAEEEIDEEVMFEVRRDLFERFPDDARARLAWAKALRSRMRYSEAEEVLKEGQFDPAQNSEAILNLAYSQFAEHKFEEALATLQSIPPSALTAPDLRREHQAVTQPFEEYPRIWAQEQELRRQEEEAEDLPIVEIQSTKGPIVIQLFENQAPNTVANFIYLAEQGFYDRTKFDQFRPDFAVEGGDPGTSPGAEGTAGEGGPGYTIPAEHLLEGARKHFRDTLAMDRGGGTNSAGSRFYFTHRPLPERNNSYTVFGRVLEGVDVVRSLREDDEIIMMLVRQKRDHDYLPDTIPVPDQPSAGGVSPNVPEPAGVAEPERSEGGEGDRGAEDPGR